MGIIWRDFDGRVNFVFSLDDLNRIVYLGKKTRIKFG